LGGEEDILESLALRGVVVWRVRVAKGRSVRGVLVRRRGVSVVRRVENIWFIGRKGKEGREGEYAGGFIGLCRLSMWSSFHLCHHGVDVILVDGATLVWIIYDESTSIKKVSSMLITLLYQ
jgi:hypothetical protein